MSLEVAFLAKVLAHPDDESPRLIYADYLDEIGDPRGIFIRVQCALEKLAPNDPRRSEFQNEEQALLGKHGDEWLAPLKGLGNGFEFRRGFVERANIESRVFLNRGEELFEKTPIRHLQILDLGSLLPRVMSSPLLGRLAVLTIFAQHLGERLVEGLATAPHLAPIRGLNLGRNRLGDRGVELLLESENLVNLTRLDLKDNGITDRGARAIAASNRIPRLNHLLVGSNELRPEGFASLLTMRHLRVLDLWRNQLGDYDTEFQPGGPHVSELIELTLCNNGLTPFSIDLLTHACRFPRLKKLDLGWNHLGSRGVEILAQSDWFDTLQSLILRDNHIGGEGVRALAHSPHVEMLEELSLGHNPIYGTGVEALIYSESLNRLRKLELSRVHLSVWVLAELTARFGTIEREP